MSRSLVSQISAISPLDGDAIDGSPRPKPRRRQAARRDFDIDAHREFACPNKNCDHREWTDRRQLLHLGQELFRVVSEFQRVDPENPVVLLHTGGVILRELTDDECRDRQAEVTRANRRGEAVSLQARLASSEYHRRIRTGALRYLTPDEQRIRAYTRRDADRGDVIRLTDNAVRDALALQVRLKRRGRPVPADVQAAANECRRRQRRGLLTPLSPETRTARKRRMMADALADDRALRLAAWPPERVKALRIELGLSQRAFAAALGGGAICEWEAGKVVPPAKMIGRLDVLADRLASLNS